MKYFKIILIITICVLSHNNVYAKSDDTTQCYNTISSGETNIYTISRDGILYRTPYYDTESQTLVKELSPIKITDQAVCVSRNYIIKEDKSLWTWNEENFKLTKIMDSVIDVSAGDFHVLILKEDGSLWGMGSNSYGQLAQGEMSESLEEQLAKDNKTRLAKCIPDECDAPVKIMDEVKSVKAGQDHSIVLKEDGSVWTFGLNIHGALGDGNPLVINNVPTKILDNAKSIFAGGSSGFAIMDNADNTMWRWGSNYFNMAGSANDVELVPVKYLSRIKSIANIFAYNLAVKKDESLWIYSDSEKSEEVDRGDRIQVPYKLLDDVNYVNGLCANYDLIKAGLVLKNNGELLIFKVTESGQESDPSYTLTKVLNNVRLSGTTPIIKNFTDIQTKPEEMQKSINALTKAGIIKGIIDTEFSPDGSMTRAEIAAVLLRMTAKPEESGSGGFSDVAKDKWYYGVAGASKKYGIVNGFEDNTFRGEDPITKEQAIVLAVRILRGEGEVSIIDDSWDYLNFQDAGTISAWAREEIALANKEGLLSVPENGMLYPDQPITRGEAAVVLYRLYDKL